MAVAAVAAAGVDLVWAARVPVAPAPLEWG